MFGFGGKKSDQPQSSIRSGTASIVETQPETRQDWFTRNNVPLPIKEEVLHPDTSVRRRFELILPYLDKASQRARQAHKILESAVGWNPSVSISEATRFKLALEQHNLHTNLNFIQTFILDQVVEFNESLFNLMTNRLFHSSSLEDKRNTLSDIEEYCVWVPRHCTLMGQAELAGIMLMSAIQETDHSKVLVYGYGVVRDKDTEMTRTFEKLKDVIRAADIIGL